MGFRLFISVLFLSLSSLVYCQKPTSSNGDSSLSYCRVERYITDIKIVADNVKEISVNVLFAVSRDDEQGVFSFKVPTAEKVKVSAYTIRVYDNNGGIIHREKSNKISFHEFANFSPMHIGSKFLNQLSPLKVELDFKLLVINPKGFYEWPAINDFNGLIDEVSLRLNFPNPDDFEFDTNIDTDQVKDAKNGGYYYLWSLQKLTPSRGEFNGVIVNAPFVRISLE